MRSQIRRRQKYAAKTDGDASKARADADGDRQRRAFTVVAGDQVGVERLTKQVLTSSGVMPGLNHFYMNFAKKIHQDKRMYSGDTLVTEVCAEYEHWRLRGLSSTVLDDIIARMGLPSCAAPVPVCDWRYKRKLTFSGNVSTTNLDDFPVLVHLTVANFDFNKAQALGQDIRFMDSDTCPSDGTPLRHEIELWDKPNSQAWVWVKVPRIDGNSVTDFIYMFYGNAAVADGQDAANVWDGSFMGVWHYKGDGTANIPDSTAAGFDGTKKGIGEPANNAASNIDGGQTFDGNDDKIQTGNLVGSYNMTIEFWTNVPPTKLTGTAENGAAVKWDGIVNWANIDFDIRLPSAASIMFYVSTTVGNFEFVASPHTNIISGTWQHWTFVGKSANYLKIYRNGTELANKNTVKVFKAMTKYVEMGRTYEAPGSNTYFMDHMDEFRISHTVRTPDWIMADYKSQSETLITYGAEEPAG